MASPDESDDDDGKGELQSLAAHSNGEQVDEHDASTEPVLVGKSFEVESRMANAGVPNAAQVEFAAPMICGIPLKWLSLVALIGQTTLQAFVIKFARAGGTQYLNSTCVFFAEVLKTITSFLLLSVEAGGVQDAATFLLQRFLGNPSECLKVSVPALAYTVQNTLIIYSLDKLSMAVQQVTYQLKIFTAALVSVALLGKQLNATKWVSLVILVVGVAIVQVPRGEKSQASAATETSGGFSDALLGFFAVLAACFMSGFAGGYMEMILKNADASLWLRNTQLGAFGVVFGIVSAMIQDVQEIVDAGLTKGYTWRVWLIIACLGFGGLLCAVVLKYADNILRQFSTALSIILTTLISWICLGEYEPDALFVLGTSLVIFATFCYNLGLPELRSVSLITHSNEQP